jgi:hypothetical protein
MIERLQRALDHVDELPEDMQEQLAEIIEEHTEPASVPPGSLAGSWGDLPDTFDEMLDELDRIRHASQPTPPLDEQLSWMDEEDHRRNYQDAEQ